MLEHQQFGDNEAVLSETLSVLRKMAKDALSLEDSPSTGMDDLLLRKIFCLFEKMATNKSAVCRDSIDVSAELFSLLQSCQTNDIGPSEAEVSFVNLLAHHCAPVHALRALSLWASEYQSASYLVPLLHTLLQRGSHDGITREISGTLLRVRYARAQSRQSQNDYVDMSSEAPVAGDTHLWRQMFEGTLAITK